MSKPTDPKAAGLGCLVVVAAVLIVVLINAFGGCKSSSPSGGAPSVTSTVSANDPAIKQAAYVATLRARGIRGSDQVLIAAGHATCTALDTGNSMTQVMLIAATSGSLTPEEAGFVVGGAVYTWCPQYQPEIDKLPTR